MWKMELKGNPVNENTPLSCAVDRVDLCSIHKDTMSALGIEGGGACKSVYVRIDTDLNSKGPSYSITCDSSTSKIANQDVQIPRHPNNV